MFLSIDARGVVKQRDLNTFEILNSFYTHHYVDQNIFKEVTDFKRDAIFLEQKKFDVKREEVIASSASEETSWTAMRSGGDATRRAAGERAAAGRPLSGIEGQKARATAGNVRRAKTRAAIAWSESRNAFM